MRITRILFIMFFCRASQNFHQMRLRTGLNDERMQGLFALGPKNMINKMRVIHMIKILKNLYQAKECGHENEVMQEIYFRNAGAP